MRKIWFLLIFAALIAEPASAQDYNKNFIECAKEVGMNLAVDPMVKGRPRMWYYQSEAQHMAFMDCVARKASGARGLSTQKPRRAPR